MKLSLSVFFPAFNDEASIGPLVERVFSVLPEVAGDYEVIVVNDGSSDNTDTVLEELRRRYSPYLSVVTHARNRGYGGALRSGFAAARKEFVFYTDGDGQYDVGELPHLAVLMDAGVGLVNGRKIKRHDPWHRIAIGFLYNQFARFIFRIQLRDIDCDFRLIRREIIRDNQLTSDSGAICVELVRMIELSPWRVLETPVHHYPRLHGRSQFFRVQSLFSTFRQILSLYWRLVIVPGMPGRARRPVSDRLP